MYCYRIRKYVGAYYAVLGRVDAVVFTGRGRPAQPGGARRRRWPGWSGSASESIRPATTAGTAPAPLVSTDGAEVAVLVVPTNEEWEIARQSLARSRR